MTGCLARALVRLYPVREEGAAAQRAGDQLLHVRLPDRVETVRQARVSLCNLYFLVGWLHFW